MTRIEKNMPIGAGQPGPEVPVGPQAANAEAKSPIPGMPSKTHETLVQHYPPKFIEEQRGKYGTHEDFLKSAEEEEAKRIDAIERVKTNAALPDNERLQATEKLLGPLTEEQGKALLEAHKVGEGKLGKDNGPVGVGNYTLHQLGEKLHILEQAGFSKEQSKNLLREGLAGFLPSSEFNGFDLSVYTGLLKQIAEQLKRRGDIGKVDENFLNRQLSRIESEFGKNTIDEAQAEGLIDKMDDWRITAEQPPTPATASARTHSEFEQIFDRLETARITGNRAVEQAEIHNITTLFNEIDALREPNGERLELFKVVRDPLIGLYSDSRIGIGQKEKLGVAEYRGQGVVDRLDTLQRAVDHAQVPQESRIFSGENSDFWESKYVTDLEQTKAVTDFIDEFKKEHDITTDLKLRDVLGGAFDYFNREGLRMIAAVVKDRKATLPDNGLMDVWHTVIKNKIERPLKNEEGMPTVAQNFDDVREAIEGARRQDPWVPNRSDYETWIQFVADDVEELREMVPYIITKVARKLGTGEENSAYQTLNQEKEKMDKALAVFPFETEGQFRRVKSEIAGDFNLEGSYIFSDRVRKGWDGFFHFEEFLASSNQENEFQEPFADAVLLDKYGETMLALEELSKEDGVFWRYGEKSVDTATKAHIPDLQRWQIRRRKEIENSLMSKKLRQMDDLLNLTLNPQGNITGYGTPKHPAFKRLKEKYDRLDWDDITKHGHILDADGNSVDSNGNPIETRWKEYCAKAMLWQQKGEFGDPREVERVTFQHPLARVLRPSEYKDTQGNVISAVDELEIMFEDDPDINNRAYASEKRRRVKKTLDRAEKVARAFMVDSASALAWFTFDKDLDIKDGDTRTIKAADRLIEINKFLQEAGESPINATETVPYKTLHRIMMQALLREDQSKPPAQKRFKFHYLLSKMGFDLDMPTYAAWNLGSHDTGRPAIMLDGVYKDIAYDPKTGREVGLAAALKASKDSGLDEKNTGAKWAEEERRMHLLMQLVIRQMFPKYFNYPGHDTKGAGVKDIRNILDPIYGISARTSWISDLTPYLLMGEQDPAKDYGASRSPLRQWLGLVKGGDEVIFRQTGYAGIIEGPRDMEAWVNRFKKVVEKYEGMTKGSKEGGPGILKSGPFSGMYLWRAFSTGGIQFPGGHYVKQVDQKDPFYAINKPEEALKNFTEEHHKAGIDLAGRTAAPLLSHMKQTVESTFGRNPESAKFSNTLLWYAVSNWMDTSWEYRSKPAYAIDGNLHLARFYMHTVFQEDEGLIYSDKEWDQMMLGYTAEAGGNKVTRYKVRINNGVEETEKEIEDQDGNIVGTKWITGTVEEGFIDSFPADLRKEIIDGVTVTRGDGKTYKKYMLPFGLSSKYPETLVNLYDQRENSKRRDQYSGAPFKKRKTVERP